MPEYYEQSTEDAIKSLKSSHDGLTGEEAQKRLKEYGYNVIEEEKRAGKIIIFLRQFKSSIVFVLIAAMVISYLIHEEVSVYAIGAIVILNAILGFYQEYKAEVAIAKLKELISLKAKVIREGKEQEIDAHELVPGDIITLETGNKIPADARLIETLNFQTHEGSLTGESTPVRKILEELKAGTPLADRKNMIFAGTTTTAGHAKAIITGTGMTTEIGKIAKMLKEAEPEPTPLQKKLAILSKYLTIVILVLVAIILGAGVVAGKELTEMLMMAIALSVASIPEGLPAVVTTSLGLAVQRMANRNALIRKLPSAETLGACTVICSDKTGTITHNEMTVKKIYVDRDVIEVTGSGYNPDGIMSVKTKDLPLLLEIGVLNNDAKIYEENEHWKILGDPTEACLYVSAKKGGVDLEELHKKMPRIHEIEFTSERKRMTTVHNKNGKKIAYIKGAPEIILGLCNNIIINGRLYHLTKEEKKRILEQNEKFTKQALRVLGFAYKELTAKDKTDKDIEKEMTFVGLQGMIDPARKEARDAIKRCRTAGIKVVMITGDHINTAVAVANDVGIKGKAITGEELDKIKDLEKHVEEIAVYARVNPEHKMRIIDALEAKGHVVAMTGDGVNDAPALKKADIGVAMGITGTDVAKEASQMVLADDNFATIVNAVEEGRTVFDNIKKFVEYLLSSNVGEVFTLFFAIMFNMPLPVLPLQLLWINLLTDGLPAIALSVEPGEEDAMKRPPRRIKEQIVNKYRGTMIFMIGLLMAIATLSVFQWYNPAKDLVKAQTMAFSVLMMLQMFNVLNQKSEEKSLFKVGIFSNKWLVVAILSSIILQLMVIYIPFFDIIFETTPLGLKDWLVVIGASCTVFVFVEIVKMFRKR